MFAFYHAGMTAGWFNIAIFVLTLTGLFAAGAIFDFINEKSENIYASWLVHMFANFAINTVGFILFGII
jgi:membrane protease YdiL (CAAX protease family)